MPESNGSNCPVCAFKHVAMAKVACEEFMLGWNEPVHAAKVIGNLGHAEQHLLAVGSQDAISLSYAIRDWRRFFETVSGDWMADEGEPRGLVMDLSENAREMIAKLDEFIRRCDAVIAGKESEAIDEPGSGPDDTVIFQDGREPAGES